MNRPCRRSRTQPRSDRYFDAFVDPEAQDFLYGDETDPTWAVDSELDLGLGGIWTITFGRVERERNQETNVFTRVDRPHRIVFDSPSF